MISSKRPRANTNAQEELSCAKGTCANEKNLLFKDGKNVPSDRQRRCSEIVDGSSKSMIKKYGSAGKPQAEARQEHEDDGHSKGSKSTAVSGDTGKVLTTPYPHKWKTTLCRFWKQNKPCPFGEAACNYAHG